MHQPNPNPSAVPHPTASGSAPSPVPSPDLSPAQLDRARGALLATAAGDALGAGYEFGPPLDEGEAVFMKGGGAFDWESGEWTDDTSMLVPMARELAAGHRLEDEATLDAIVTAWIGWARTAPDVGAQTRGVLTDAHTPTARGARAAAIRLHERTGRSAGNGSLMRTAPVALGYLGAGREAELAAAALSVSALTHADESAGEACAIWCLAIRHAVLTGELNLRGQLRWLADDRAAFWAQILDVAQVRQPRDFERNGWVVEALQGAWSAITHGAGLVDTLERAVRGGLDTDTVAAIAGGLAGAVHGASALPAEWIAVLHGWPGLDAAGLGELAERAVRAR
ncbi:ADP-ribosylglycohydrolase family protein [Galactobacter caseinivorans]|uniref:ADP-ribosylglycohydrolase family protein n=1 Tax=Galactobacter caseinivorans TaxID=2676123 RepID=A0A496PHG5_9MICC|nr:ADP-ribosylglycohydrolase family protein [Galactobacter caseinivorans]RKW69927.1 ADP-ribosylglycohydrolase family protein [Galactobacter caseinivorans]